MTKNNNVWGALMTPVVNRPGDATAARIVHSTKTPPPPRAKKPDTGQHMPAAQVAAAHRDPKDPWTQLLSPRQHQVLDMLVQGMSPTQIARELELSKSAVSKYTTEIKARLEVETLPQAVVAWHRHYRVLHPDPNTGNKDDTLIANLARAVEQQRAARKEAA